MKKLPYWLKGGLIVGGIAALIIILNLIYCIGREPEFCTVFALMISIPFIFILNFLESMGRFGSLYPPKLFLPIVIFLYFLIGTIIGLIIGKIKSKK